MKKPGHGDARVFSIPIGQKEPLSYTRGTTIGGNSDQQCSNPGRTLGHSFPPVKRKCAAAPQGKYVCKLPHRGRTRTP